LRKKLKNMKTYTEPDAYDVIQRDVESNFHTMIGKKSEDIKNICIVGAWHGYEIVSLWRNYPNSNIYAFEAHPAHYNVLFSRYKNTPRVKLYNKAVTNYDGWIDFYETEMTGNGSILRCQVNDFGHPNKVIEKIKLPCTTLKTELCDVQFDLLWVDVQGAELQVLKGVDLNNCDSMFLEIHTHDFIKPWDREPYKGQCYKEDLEKYLSDSHIIHSIGLDNKAGNGQGNSFWVKK